MNTNAIVVKALEARRAKLGAELAALDTAIITLGGTSAPPVGGAPVRTRKRRKLSPEQIAKMVAGRQAAREAKSKANGAEAVEQPAKPLAKAKGASLAAAAE